MFIAAQISDTMTQLGRLSSNPTATQQDVCVFVCRVEGGGLAGLLHATERSADLTGVSIPISLLFLFTECAAHIAPFTAHSQPHAQTIQLFLTDNAVTVWGNY